MMHRAGTLHSHCEKSCPPSHTVGISRVVQGRRKVCRQLVDGRTCRFHTENGYQPRISETKVLQTATCLAIAIEQK
jgi:hypothetical protein